MYDAEKGQQEAKIAKMKEDGVDEYDVRKQEEVLAETVMMIPERRTALESAVQDLNDLLVRPAQAERHLEAPRAVTHTPLNANRAGRGRRCRPRGVRGDYCGEGFSQLGCRTAWRLSADVLRLNDVSFCHTEPPPPVAYAWSVSRCRPRAASATLRSCWAVLVATISSRSCRGSLSRVTYR